MSEHSIDVDVNFNLNDINKLFEKILKGAGEGGTDLVDALTQILDLEKLKKDGFISDISESENQEDIIKTILKSQLGTTAFNDLFKMVNDLTDNDQEENELLQKTQNNLITMLGMSKLMIKMIDERFPISAEMQDEIENMSKILTDKEMMLDDKMDIISRTLQSMLATSTGQNPAFRTITPMTAGALPEGMIKGMNDEFGVSAGIVGELIERIREAKSGRIRTEQLKDLLDSAEMSVSNMTGIFERAGKSMTDTAGVLENIEVGGGETTGRIIERETEGQRIQRNLNAGESVKNMLFIIDMMKEVHITFEQFTENAKSQVDMIVENMDVATEGILKLARELDPEKIGVTKAQIRKMKTVMEEGLDKIANKIDAEFSIRTIEEIWRLAIENRLVEDPLRTARELKLDALIKMTDSVYNTLLSDYDKFTKSKKGREALEQAGLDQAMTTPRLLDVIRERRSGINLENMLTATDQPTSTEFKSELIKDMFRQIQTQEQKTSSYMGTMKDDMKIMLTTINNTETVAKATKTSADKFSKSFSAIRGAVNSATEQLKASHSAIKDTTTKMNEVITTINDTGIITGQDIDTLNDEEE